MIPTGAQVRLARAALAAGAAAEHRGGAGRCPASRAAAPWRPAAACCLPHSTTLGAHTHTHRARPHTITHAEVQRRAAPVILSGSDCVIASETGSGARAEVLPWARCHRRCRCRCRCRRLRAQPQHTRPPCDHRHMHKPHTRARASAPQARLRRSWCPRSPGWTTPPTCSPRTWRAPSCCCWCPRSSWACRCLHTLCLALAGCVFMCVRASRPAVCSCACASHTHTRAHTHTHTRTHAHAGVHAALQAVGGQHQQPHARGPR
jgi:hypothetical protein